MEKIPVLGLGTWKVWRPHGRGEALPLLIEAPWDLEGASAGDRAGDFCPDGLGNPRGYLQQNLPTQLVVYTSLGSFLCLKDGIF